MMSRIKKKEILADLKVTRTKRQLYQANLLLKMIDLEIKKIDLHIIFLRRKKPFCFQKKKMITYLDSYNELQGKREYFCFLLDEQNHFIDSLKNIFKDLTGFDYVDDV